MGAPRVDRRLAAVLAADVVGYSRLVQRDEQGTLDRLKAHRKQLVEPLVAEHGGRVVKLMGDGILCEFPSAVHAVTCAVTIQRGMAEREAAIPEAERIRLRIGINVGDVIHEAGDILGDGVNVAARLEALAEPGGVCIARNVHNQVKDKLAFRFESAGRHRVKNIAEPVEVWRVAPGEVAARPVRKRWPRPAALAAVLLLSLVVMGSVGGWWWYERRSLPWAAGPSLPDRPTIAVLAFDDLGGDERQKRLADAFAEDLITELARSRDLLVIARNSSFTYKGKPVDVRQVGRELGVRYVLEGSLQTGPERVRVTAQLIDAATGAHLWTERYDRPPDDLFAVHDEVVGRIVGTLTGYSGPLAKTGAEGARRKRPESLRAYDYYLLAKAPYIRHDAAGMVEARRLLEKALALDPELIRAWDLLAWTHFRDAIGGWGDAPQRSWEAFHAAARTAAELDPMDGGAHVVAGMSHFVRDEVEQGAAAWDRALALSPNDTNVLRPIGAQLALATGVERAAQGVELVERAMRLDPLHPPNVASALGFACYYAGCHEKGIVAFKRRASMNVDHHIFLAMSYAQLGRKEEAAVAVAEVLREEPGFTAEAWVDHDFFQPGGSSAALFFDGARKAGLPLCAPAAEAARFDPRNRLSACEAERARLAAPKT